MGLFFNVNRNYSKYVKSFLMLSHPLNCSYDWINCCLWTLTLLNKVWNITIGICTVKELKVRTSYSSTFILYWISKPSTSISCTENEFLLVFCREVFFYYLLVTLI